MSNRKQPQIRNYSNGLTFEVGAEVSKIIAENYDKLWQKYVTDKSTLNMCQTTEDIFQNTLLKVMQELTSLDEESVLDYIDWRFNLVKFQTVMDNKELHKYQNYLEDANTEKARKTEE